MITVTRLDGSPILLNADLLVTIERTPDTLVSLTTGDKVLVRETPEQVVDRITAYKREVLRVMPAVRALEEPV
jgi:flagellar protein FlbD